MKNANLIVKKLLFSFGLLGPLRKSALWKYKNKSHYKHFEENVTDTFSKVIRTLDDSDLIVWPEYGTLLGIVRDNNFIKNDLDIDLATHFEKEKPNKISSLLLSNQFSLMCRINDKNNNVYLEKYMYNSVPVDVYYVHEKRNKYCTYDLIQDSSLHLHEIISLGGSPKLYRNEFSPFLLKKIKFLGLDIHVPDNLNKHLKELYGENFTIPDPGYDCNTRDARFVETEVDFNFEVYELEYSN